VAGEPTPVAVSRVTLPSVLTMFASVKAVIGNATAVRLKSLGVVDVMIAALTAMLPTVAKTPTAICLKYFEFTRSPRGRLVPTAMFESGLFRDIKQEAFRHRRIAESVYVSKPWVAYAHRHDAATPGTVKNPDTCLHRAGGFTRLRPPPGGWRAGKPNLVAAW
jgi:hypothetical protein